MVFSISLKCEEKVDINVELRKKEHLSLDSEGIIWFVKSRGIHFTYVIDSISF